MKTITENASFTNKTSAVIALYQECDQFIIKHLVWSDWSDQFLQVITYLDLHLHTTAVNSQWKWLVSFRFCCFFFFFSFLCSSVTWIKMLTFSVSASQGYFKFLPSLCNKNSTIQIIYYTSLQLNSDTVDPGFESSQWMALGNKSTLLSQLVW